MGTTPLLKITEMFAFIANATEGEGIPAFEMRGIVYPLIGADMARVDSLRQMAQDVANAEGITLTLARFTVREDLEEITPAPLVTP